MPARIAVFLFLLVGGIAALLAAGVFSFTLGSFLIWGFILGIGLAMASRFTEWAQVVGPIYSLGYTVALVVFLVQELF